MSFAFRARRTCTERARPSRFAVMP
jgi:hypothetical protein